MIIVTYADENKRAWIEVEDILPEIESEMSIGDVNLMQEIL